MTVDRRPKATAEADAIFERLCAVTDGLDQKGAAAALARLCVVLAHHVGDLETIDEAIRIARGSRDETPPNREDAHGGS